MEPQLRIILGQILIKTICVADDFGGRALPTMVVLALGGWVVLGYVRKQVSEQYSSRVSTSVLASNICPDFSHRQTVIVKEKSDNSLSSQTAFGHGVFVTVIESKPRYHLHSSVTIF